jgi:hypothetical protein
LRFCHNTASIFVLTFGSGTSNAAPTHHIHKFSRNSLQVPTVHTPASQEVPIITTTTTNGSQKPTDPLVSPRRKPVTPRKLKASPTGTVVSNKRTNDTQQSPNATNKGLDEESIVKALLNNSQLQEKIAQQINDHMVVSRPGDATLEDSITQLCTYNTI